MSGDISNFALTFAWLLMLSIKLFPAVLAHDRLSMHMRLHLRCQVSDLSGPLGQGW